MRPVSAPTLQLVILVAAGHCAAVDTEGPAPPPVSRIGISDGRFVEKDTGKPFVPVGANYYRVGEFKKGKKGHVGFCPGFYDRAYVETMMATLKGWGFNTVRTFHNYHVGENGILTSQEAKEIAPGYLANVIHFLKQARKNGIHVIFSWPIWHPPSDWWASQALPGEAGADLRPDWDPLMGLNGFRICRRYVRTRANAIAALIEAVRRKDPGLLPVVLAWELENEVLFVSDKSPFNRRAGTFRFAGKDYSLSSDEDTQSLMDDMIVQWANLCAETVHRADPEALVSSGVFTFRAVNRGRPGTLSEDETNDPRIPARPLALLRSKLDYIDLHLYARKTDTIGIGEYLALNLKSVEWDKLHVAAQKAGKPILVGECGVFTRYLRKPPNWKTVDHKLGVAYFREHLEGLTARGFAGALAWHYGNPDSTPDTHLLPLALFPQYAHVLRDVWVRR